MYFVISDGGGSLGAEEAEAELLALDGMQVFATNKRCDNLVLLLI